MIVDKDTVWAMEFSPNELELVTASADGTIRMWARSLCKAVLCIMCGVSSNVVSLQEWWEHSFYTSSCRPQPLKNTQRGTFDLPSSRHGVLNLQLAPLGLTFHCLSFKSSFRLYKFFSLLVGILNQPLLEVLFSVLV
eukprot:1887646-Amphidinium_carterae.1